MSTKGRGKVVNRGELAEIHGVALTTIDTWVRGNCPVLQRGARGVEWSFNTAEVARWREDERARQATAAAPTTREELDIRRATADTLRAELELAKARDEVAPVAEFEKATGRLMAAIRTNMLNIPQRAVLRLLGEKNETAFKKVLRDEIALALETSADVEVMLDNDEEEQDNEE
ncbi:terminase small subunit [Paraburkholderia sp. J12]|uniref:terminase small subunit n=1 Tax=Paraburkholderia sp. J12 TaxID=2805432 RepID=UPI002ABD14CB|nr:terminase small subunit [Paraburkholderia sp. J12]